MLTPSGFNWPRNANDPIILGEQEAVLRIGTKKASTIFKASVQMLPRPEILIEALIPNSPFNIYFDFGNMLDADLTPSGSMKPSKLIILNATGSNPFLIQAAPHQERAIHFGKKQAVATLQGTVLNNYDCLDFDASNNASRLITFSGSGCLVTLQGNPNLGEITSDLNKRGGYGVTHVFEVKRQDSSEINPADQANVLEALRFFLSFGRGAYCGIGITSGSLSGSNASWTDWGFSRTSRWSTTWNWFSHSRGESLRALFPGFMERWNGGWHKHMKSLVDMYCEANRDDVDVKPSLILAQAALELLSWVVLVDGGALSPAGFEKLQASDQIRLLLHEYQIPPVIPAGLTTLINYARGNKLDGPSSIVEIRNSLVHPAKKSGGIITPDILGEV